MAMHVVPSSAVSSSSSVAGGVRGREVRSGTWAAAAVLLLAVMLPAKATAAQELDSGQAAVADAVPAETTSSPVMTVPLTTAPVTTPPVTAAPVAATPPAPASLMNLPTRAFDLPAEGYGSVAAWECSPHLRGGTRIFGDMLTQASGGRYTYQDVRPCGASWGITYSQHKTGRAIDFMVDSRNLQGRLDGMAVISWLFETVDGVPHARLRRLGVVEIIWDGRIWTTETDAANTNPDPAAWRPYTGLGCSGDPIGQGTECHFDHFHFTLSQAGSEGLVTFNTPLPAA